jgi:hypothetical protein
VTRFDFKQRSYIHVEEIRSASAEDAWQSLLMFLRQAEDTSYVDFDELMQIGVLVRNNPGNLASRTVDWLGRALPSTRLDLVCALLCDFWLPNGKSSAPDPGHPGLLAKLAALKGKDRSTPDAEYSYAMAMHNVAQNLLAPITTREFAVAQIEAVAMRGTGDASLNKSPLGMRNRHRASSSFRPVTVRLLYRAYMCSGDSDASYIGESTESHRKVVRILSLTHDPSASALSIEYEKCDPALSNIVAVDAIQCTLLNELLDDKYAESTSRVRYIDKSSRFDATHDYVRARPLLKTGCRRALIHRQRGFRIRDPQELVAGIVKRWPRIVLAAQFCRPLPRSRASA